MAKQLTEEEAQARKDKAVRFVRDVLDDSDHADDIEDEDLYDWADRKHIQIVNQGVSKMANGNVDPRTKSDLLDEISELQEENADLQDQLNAIADIIGPDDTGDDEDDDDDGQ